MIRALPSFKERGRPPKPDRDTDYYYPDTGCALWSRCLTCPLPRCIEDERPENQAEILRYRDDSIYQRWLGQDPKNVAALAREFGVSRRTAFRAIARQRPTGDRRLPVG